MNKQDEICKDVLVLLQDYSNLFMTSSVCVAELIHLIQIGKVTSKRQQQWDTTEVIDVLDTVGIAVVPADKRHLKKLSELHIYMKTIATPTTA